MPTNEPTQIAVGYLPDAQDVLYEVPTGKMLLLSSIRFGVNINTTDEEIKFYYTLNGVTFLAAVATLGENERGIESEIGMVLNADDTIEGETTTEDMVPFFIFGALRDVN